MHADVLSPNASGMFGNFHAAGTRRNPNQPARESIRWCVGKRISRRDDFDFFRRAPLRVLL